MKHAKAISTIALAASAAFSTGAQAVVTDWGPHDATEVGLGFIAAGGIPTGFADVFTFTVGTGSVLTSTSAASLTTAPLSPIVSGTYALLSYGGDGILGTGDDSVVGTWAYDTTSGSVVNAVSAGAGKYLYAISGVAQGVGGSYILTSTVTPVPEPQALVLMLAGLGVLGAVARRRQG